MTHKALAAAEELALEGIDAEVVDLRTVDYANMDFETIGASVKKTGRAVICEEGLFAGGLGAQVSFEIQRRFFDYLDAEVYRVAAEPVPVPVSKALEDFVIPGPAEIVSAAHEICA
jgi:pyruvate/2-oxoglutarate/acetoin dehydrogenase E1 component